MWVNPLSSIFYKPPQVRPNFFSMCIKKVEDVARKIFFFITQVLLFFFKDPFVVLRVVFSSPEDLVAHGFPREIAELPSVWVKD